MFELFELILSSPVGAFILSGIQNALYAVIVVSDCEDCGFNDLGALLLGGVFAAIIVGVVISVLWRGIQARTAGASGFVSIRSSDTRK